jgi:hypothetical protein
MWSGELWGGFVEGRLDKQHIDDGFGGSHIRYAPALFSSRREARQQYQDVRKIGLTELLNVPRKRAQTKG